MTRPRPLRILHVYKGYPPVLGGIEGHLATLARGQARRGHQVSVLVTRPGGLGTRVAREVGFEPAHGVDVIRAGAPITLRSTPLSPSLLTAFLRIRGNVDVIHLHLPFPPGEALGLLARLRSARRPGLIASYHSDIVKQRVIGALWRPWQRRLLVKADRVLVASHAYRMRSRQLTTPVRSEIVPYGVDLRRFASPDHEAVARWKQRFPGPIALFVGRLRYYKGVTNLVSAADRLHADAPTQLVIAGTGPEEDALRLQAAASSAAPRVHFLGDVDDADLPSLYAAADVTVLPSTLPSEAFGIVLVESMASGTPIISTELGTGTSEINRDGETGAVVPPADPDALARAIAGIVDDSVRQQTLGLAARAHARACFDQEAMIDRIIDLYPRPQP